MDFKACMWLREISSCSCLTDLPGPAWLLLNKFAYLLNHLCIYWVTRQDVILKWRETKRHPSRATSGHQISCSLVSLHFLCDILSSHSVGCRLVIVKAREPWHHFQRTSQEVVSKDLDFGGKIRLHGELTHRKYNYIRWVHLPELRSASHRECRECSAVMSLPFAFVHTPQLPLSQSHSVQHLSQFSVNHFYTPESTKRRKFYFDPQHCAWLVSSLIATTKERTFLCIRI